MLGRLTRDRIDSTLSGGSGQLADALARLAMPAAPVSQPWEFSAGAVLRPHLPTAVGRMSTVLDRLGAVRIGPTSVGLDSHRDVPWTDVAEIRTRSLFDMLSDGFVEELRRRSADLVPPLPGAGKASRWACDKVAELTLSLLLLALPEAPDQGVPDIPAEIVHRGRRGRRQHMSPGLVASAVLTLPAVRESLLATARAHGVAVVASGPSAVTAAANERSAVLAHRRSQLTMQLEGLRGTAGPRTEPDEQPTMAAPTRATDQERTTMGLFSRSRSAIAQRPAAPATAPRDVGPLYPAFYQEALVDTGKPVTDNNVLALAGLAASNLALNANLWFDKLGDASAKRRWMQEFGDPALRPDFDRLVRVPDQMIDFLWAWDHRAHGGVRDFIRHLHTTLREAANRYRDELPLDMWGAKE